MGNGYYNDYYGDKYYDKEHYKDHYYKDKHEYYDPGYGCSDYSHFFRRYILHVIQKGDTFYNLGQRYGVPVEKILDLNPCAEPKNLQIGQIVIIPCPRKGYY